MRHMSLALACGWSCLWLIKLIAIIVAFSFASKAISALIRKKLRATFTALDEISFLSPRKDGLKIRGTAIVCGGSIAGLLSARICSNHFDRVVVIEPEEWLTTLEGQIDRHRQVSAIEPFHQKRARVPQYTSLHGVQPFSILTLRKLFQNFDLEIKRAGARMMPLDIKAHWSGIPLVAPWHQYSNDTFPQTVFLTRPGYETTLRRLVLSTCPNIKFITGIATSLVPQPSSANVVASVRMRSGSGDEITLPATLVVDCTGPAMGGLRWLQDFPPTIDVELKNNKRSTPLQALKTTYNPKMAYTTCEFDVPPRLFGPLKELGFPEDYETAGFQYVYFCDPKRDKRNVIIARREYNYLQIACGGWDVRERITSIADIKIFLSQLLSERQIPSWINSMLELFEEENVFATYVHFRCPPSVYLQYHRAKNLPSNFVAIGDSIMQLNPIRGHGCTKACVEAVTLNTLLSRCNPGPSRTPNNFQSLPEDFSRNFFALQARRTGSLWYLATIIRDAYKIEDYGWKSTIPAEGDDLQSFGRWSRAYGSDVMKLALKDREVASVLWHITNWLVPPTEIFSPMIFMKIVWMRIRDVLRS